MSQRVWDDTDPEIVEELVTQPETKVETIEEDENSYGRSVFVKIDRVETDFLSLLSYNGQHATCYVYTSKESHIAPIEHVTYAFQNSIQFAIGNLPNSLEYIA